MEQYDEIDNFLEGKLQGEELEKFTEKLNHNKEFAELVSSYVETKHGVMYANRLSIKKKLELLDQDQPKDKASFRIWKIAASVAVLMILSFTAWYIYTPSNQEQIFIANYQPLSQIEIPTSRTETEDDDFLKKAFIAYQTKDFEGAETYLNKVSRERTYNSYADFIKGLVQMETKNYKSAIDLFNKSLQVKVPISKDVRWYLGLCYIKLNQTKKARIELERLSNSNYALRVSNILKKL